LQSYCLSSRGCIERGEPLTEEERREFSKRLGQIEGELINYKRDSKVKEKVIEELREKPKPVRPVPSPRAVRIYGKKVFSVDGKYFGRAVGWAYSEPEGYVGIEIKPYTPVTKERVIGWNLRSYDVAGLVANAESIQSSDVLIVRLTGSGSPSDLMTSSQIARLKERIAEQDRELAARRAEHSKYEDELARYRNFLIGAWLANPIAAAPAGGQKIVPRAASRMSAEYPDLYEALIELSKANEYERSRSAFNRDVSEITARERDAYKELATSRFPDLLNRLMMSDLDVMAETLTKNVDTLRDLYQRLPQDVRDIFMQLVMSRIERISSPEERERARKAAEAVAGGAPVEEAGGEGVGGTSAE